MMGEPGLACQVMLVFHFVVQHAHAQEGKEAQSCTAEGAGRDVMIPFRGDGKIRPVGAFRRSGAWILRLPRAMAFSCSLLSRLR